MPLFHAVLPFLPGLPRDNKAPYCAEHLLEQKLLGVLEDIIFSHHLHLYSITGEYNIPLLGFSDNKQNNLLFLKF